MSEVRSHKCPSCGGNLDVDVNKQLYHCSFCGRTFDYEYFREDNMHELSEKYLSSGEFSSAIEAFQFILKKDPHDFRALRGIMLGAARFSDTQSMLRADGYENFNYKTELVNKVNDNCLDQDKDYFNELTRLYSEMKKLSDMHHSHKELLNEKKRIDSKLNAELGQREACNFIGKNGVVRDPVYPFILMNFVTGFFLFLIIFLILWSVFAADSDVISSNILLAVLISIPTIIFGAFNFIVFYPRYKSAKLLDACIRQTHQQEAEINHKIDESDKAIHRLIADVRRDCLAFISRDDQKLGLET